jgi:hypothetical protein
MPTQELAGHDLTAVNRVVLQLNAICKGATFEFAMAVGRLVIDEFYRGDLQAWRERGRKTASFRRLAQHPDLPMSPAALYRSVAIYALSRRLYVQAPKHLSTTHFRLVLPLAGEHQEELLRHAETDSWSVERLREEIADRGIQPVSHRGGRTRRPRIEASLQKLTKCLDEVQHAPVVEPLSAETAKSVRDLIQNLRRSCDRLERTFGRHMPCMDCEIPSALDSAVPCVGEG